MQPPPYATQQAAQPQQPYPQGQPGVTQPAQYVAAQAPVNVIHQTAPSRGPRIYEKYKSSAARILGIIMIVAGVLCIIFNAVGIAVQNKRESYYSIYYFYYNASFYSGVGFWGSIFLFITGGLTIGAAGSKTNCLIVGSLVMSILSAAITGLGLLINASISVAVDEYIYLNGRYPNSAGETSLAMSALLLVLAFVVGGVTIAASALACCAVCCDKRTRDPTVAYVTTTTQYVASPQPAQAYPQTTASYPQAQAGYPQTQAGYPQTQIGYPQAQPAPQGQGYNNAAFQPNAGQTAQPGREKMGEPTTYEPLQYNQ